MSNIETLDPVRYPIGKFIPPAQISPDLLSRSIETISDLPTRLHTMVAEDEGRSLSKTYREGGWTMRQIIHHMADSHVNGYVRFHWALTEESPSIKLYDQNAWAALPEASMGPIKPSLVLLEGLHRRWATVLHTMKDEDWHRTFYRSDRDRTVPLWEAAAHYAWHCAHHLAHIRGCMSN